MGFILPDIEEFIEQTYELPAIPIVAQKVIAMVRDPETNARDLQNVIQTDPAMTTKILRIANSSLTFCATWPSQWTQTAARRSRFSGCGLQRTQRPRPPAQ